MRLFFLPFLQLLVILPSSLSFSVLVRPTTPQIASRTIHHRLSYSIPADVEEETEETFDPADAFEEKASKSPLDWLEEEDILASDNNNDHEDGTQLLLRALDGTPLTTDYFETVMDLPPGSVTSYACPDDTTVFHGLMSDACRIQLSTTSTTTTRSAFYKRICFSDLSHCQEKLKHAPHKLTRDMQSYQVVAAWMQSQACRMVCNDSTSDIFRLRIPTCYDAQLQPNLERPMEAKFSFLLEDFSPTDGWYQQWLLDDTLHCHAALATFAHLHAYFWTGSDFYNENAAARMELQEAIWHSGSYVQPLAQTTATVDQCAIVAREWDNKKWKFEEHLSDFPWWDTLGERLQSVATECGRVAHPFAYPDDPIADDCAKYRTFTHGDPKQANLLFRDTTQSQTTSSLDVGLIDFQWTGFGLAATDIAHCVTSSMHADMLVNGGEDELLHYYYDTQLTPKLVQFGVFTDIAQAHEQYSFETFLEQYETAVLDICRLMIAYTWSRFDEAVTRDDPEACERTLNKTSYNKSIPNIVWLLQRCDEILTKRGV